uniref:Regulator of G protein signaling 19 n=1 Tax=Hucho hucho TaxID=62062 RepID=A0A4W5KP45_9TELE
MPELRMMLKSLSIAKWNLWSVYLIISLRIPSTPQAFLGWRVCILSCSSLSFTHKQVYTLSLSLSLSLSLIYCSCDCIVVTPQPDSDSDPLFPTAWPAGTNYTGPVPADGESPMAVSQMSPSRAQRQPNTQRPNTCCFCWCCCCSCSWNEEDGCGKSLETRLETIPNCEDCPKPTLDEIRVWAQSFDKLMKNPAGRNVFREFLRTEYSEENMLFWLACEDLKQEMNKNTVEEKARLIYEDYISILSPKEV